MAWVKEKVEKSGENNDDNIITANEDVKQLINAKA